RSGLLAGDGAVVAQPRGHPQARALQCPRSVGRPQRPARRRRLAGRHAGDGAAVRRGYRLSAGAAHRIRLEFAEFRVQGSDGRRRPDLEVLNGRRPMRTKLYCGTSLIALSAAIAGISLVPAAARGDAVGVTGAVNPSATGTPPGAPARPLIIGTEVLF